MITLTVSACGGGSSDISSEDGDNDNIVSDGSSDGDADGSADDDGDSDENNSQNLSCDGNFNSSSFFVDGDSICGTCSDSITRDDNSITAPWCTISHAVEMAEPGETIYIRQGSYRESVDLPQSGEDASPITLSAFASEEVIIEGSEILDNWTACESQTLCHNNPNWQSIYYAFIPAEHAQQTDAQLANLFEQNELLAVSQEPDQPDTFYIDDIDYFYTIDNSLMTSTQLTDSNVFNQDNPHYWDDSYALLWVSHNIVNFRKIDSFDPSTSSITFAETDNPPYSDRNELYSVFNGVHLIDMPGEYSITDTLEQDGSRKVYLWPKEAANPDDTTITYSVRNYGININRQSYWTIKGITVQKQTGDQLTNGIGIGSVSQGTDIHQITLQNNTVRFNRHSQRGYGGIYLSHCNDCRVENNEVYENIRHYGIFSTYPARNMIKNNIVRRPGLTCIANYYARQLQIIENDLSGCSGNHANTITVYLDSQDILIANNYIHDSRGSLTLQNSGNITIYNNIIDSGDRNHAIDEWGGNSSGTYLLIHNHFLNANNYALNIGNESARYIIKNNIIDGFCPDDEADIDVSHNLYVGLAWCQAERYGWTLENGSIIEENQSLLFTDPDNKLFSPIASAPHSGAATDISDLLPTDTFPDFDFTQDYLNNTRAFDDTSTMGAIDP